RQAIEAMNAAPAPVAAVDIPSGLSADDGRVMGLAVRAELTATFGLAKVGQLIHPGRECCGRLEVVDISIPKRFVDESGVSCFELEAADAAAWWPRLSADAHKGSAGHLLVLAGSPGKTGAACLTAEGALRAGAGLVTVGCPLSLNPILEAKLTEAMTQPLAETSEATLGLVSKSGVESIMAGKTALAIGPGLSPHPEVGELLAWLLGACDKPTVIDADALNLLARRPELIKDAAGPLVLTPHPGEMARLMGLAPAQIQADRVGFARQGAREWNQVVVLKGANSLIAAPDGRVFINPTGNAGLASGGSGDVLTGLISALLAQGVEPLKAACAGVFVHGLAADRLWDKMGGRGYIAGEVAREVPAAVASLGGLFQKFPHTINDSPRA
ncbi:MAG: NAD(P)H-hydrate dehydratase, partial [Deltaproteobacteria bacterium]|nr:NAD(P)H-hydrate dehydratase [Deltaproteobacteria bacterium]